MAKLDIRVTRHLQEWLNTPPEKRDIREGADLMLSLNRNRALYNSIIRQPEKFLPKLEYELRKFLHMRLNDMSVADTVRLEKRVMPSVREIVGEPPVISTDDELPEAYVAKGRRKDHDSLPRHIQELWESNGRRYRQMVLLFNELKGMDKAMPCDRFEKLRILDEVEGAYRANLELYDSYVKPTVADNDTTAVIDADSSATKTADIAKLIGAARKTISTNKKVLASLAPDSPKRPAIVSRIQSAVDVIKSSGAAFTVATMNELQAIGIVF